MARGKKAVSPFQQARVNLTWFARALEGDETLESAIDEVYRDQPGMLARDIRVLLTTPWVRSTDGSDDP